MNTPTHDAPMLTRPHPVSGETQVRSAFRGLLLHFSIVLSLATVTAFNLGGARSALSAGLGVTLAGINLLVMRKVMSGLIHAEGASTAWAIVLPLKLLGLVGAAFALVDLRVAQPVPLAIGFALLPLTGVFLPRASSVPGKRLSEGRVLEGRVLDEVVPPRSVRPSQILK
jgi:hypothetical protein